ncbi:hypothetical protein FRC12_015692 [Ceratobasidium sp. 428]|nr:hypothetical protein FRC12_015692 [Ceratobasidium sp. 428]
MQKLQQKKAPPAAPRRFGNNAWLPHKRPNMQNARAKLGVAVKPGAKAGVAGASTGGEKATPAGAEKSTALVPDVQPTTEDDTSEAEVDNAPELMSAPPPPPVPVPAPIPGPVSAPALASTPATVPESMDSKPTPPPPPEPRKMSETPATRPPSLTPAPATPTPSQARLTTPNQARLTTPAPVRLTTPAPTSITTAASAISPPFVPTPMLGTPIPSTPKTLPSSALGLVSSNPSTPGKTSGLPRPPTLPPTPSTGTGVGAGTVRTPSTSPGSTRQGPTIASLVRPRTQSPTKEMVEGGRGKTSLAISGAQQLSGVNAQQIISSAMRQALAGQMSSVKVAQTSSQAGGAGDGGGDNRPKVVLPALPAGMPQRPAWIPTNQQAGSNQDSSTSGSTLTPAPWPLPPAPTGLVEKPAGVNKDVPITPVDTTQVDKGAPTTRADKDTPMTTPVPEPPPPDSTNPSTNNPETRDPPPDNHRSKEETHEPRSGITSRLPSVSPSKSQTSPSCSMQISPPTTQASSPVLSTVRASSPAVSTTTASPSGKKRKSELDARGGFEAQLKKRRRHRESITKSADGEQSSSVAETGASVSSAPSFASLTSTPSLASLTSGPSLASLTSAPSLASLSSGPSLTSFASLGDSAFGASLPPLSPLLPRPSNEELLTPKESIRARLLGQRRWDQHT